jgi:hypothetical protein
MHNEPGRDAARRRPSRPPCQGARRLCGACACQRHAAAAGPEPPPESDAAQTLGLSRSPASSPLTTTANLVPPGSRSSTSVAGSSRRSAEQVPPDTTRVGAHGAAPVGRHRRKPAAPQFAGSVRPWPSKGGARVSSPHAWGCPSGVRKGLDAEVSSPRAWR